MPVPNVPGSLPNMFLGTGLYDAPILSIATGIVGILLFLFYQIRLVKKARANGEGYDGEAVADLDLSGRPAAQLRLLRDPPGGGCGCLHRLQQRSPT